jgi:hypothetical protein
MNNATTTIAPATKALPSITELRSMMAALGMPETTIRKAEKDLQTAIDKQDEQARITSRLMGYKTVLSSFKDVEVSLLEAAQLLLAFNKLMDWKKQVFKDGSVEEGYYLPLMFGSDVASEIDDWFTKIEIEVDDQKVFANNQNFLTNLVDTLDSDPDAINRRALSRERGTQSR